MNADNSSTDGPVIYCAMSGISLTIKSEDISAPNARAALTLSGPTTFKVSMPGHQKELIISVEPVLSEGAQRHADGRVSHTAVSDTGSPDLHTSHFKPEHDRTTAYAEDIQMYEYERQSPVSQQLVFFPTAASTRPIQASSEPVQSLGAVTNATTRTAPDTRPASILYGHDIFSTLSSQANPTSTTAEQNWPMQNRNNAAQSQSEDDNAPSMAEINQINRFEKYRPLDDALPNVRGENRKAAVRKERTFLRNLIKHNFQIWTTQRSPTNDSTKVDLTDEADIFGHVGTSARNDRMIYYVGEVFEQNEMLGNIVATQFDIHKHAIKHDDARDFLRGLAEKYGGMCDENQTMHIIANEIEAVWIQMSLKEKARRTRKRKSGAAASTEGGSPGKRAMHDAGFLTNGGYE
ncbi:Hypothetical protein D9617_1g080710 [Elsinoe fawcettii]|nr:Hypothetical protein D9617_1g080710 [Elsinoe fawcettii]